MEIKKPMLRAGSTSPGGIEKTVADKGASQLLCGSSATFLTKKDLMCVNHDTAL